MIGASGELPILRIIHLRIDVLFPRDNMPHLARRMVRDHSYIGAQCTPAVVGLHLDDYISKNILGRGTKERG
jgi:hypothetical protein